MPIVHRLDRVLILTDDPPSLADRLVKTLALAIVEPFALHGTYASVRLDAGSSDIEIIRLGPPVAQPADDARFFGLAFEPACPLEEAIRELDAANIPHGPPSHVPHAGEMRRWTNVPIHNLLDGGLVFLCEYAPTLDRSPPHAQQAANLEELRLTVPEGDARTKLWRRLLHTADEGVAQTSRAHDGPAIRLERGAASSIESLTFSLPANSRRARSVTEACVRPDLVGGLDILIRDG